MPRENPYDRSAKVLCRERPADFLGLVLPGLDPASIRVENPELNVAEKRADAAFLVGDDTAYVTEFMIEPDRRRLREFFVKTALAADVLRERDVLLLVFYLTSGGHRELPDVHEATRGAVRTRFEFTAVPLWEHREAIAAGRHRALAPFLTLWAPSPDAVAGTLGEVRRLALEEPDPRVRADLLSVAMTIALRAVPDKPFLLSFFREELTMLRESTFVDDWIQEGIEKGLRQGELGTGRKDVLAVLETRFDVIPPDVATDVNSTSDSTLLSQILRLAAKAVSLDDFRAKLAIALGRR